jgi:LAO/AO transport system kinase
MTKTMILAEEVLAGSEGSAARLISLIEQENPEGYKNLLGLLPHTGNAHLVGITGCAGAGKSTLINALALRLAKEGTKIGIIAVDPSSSLTKGSLLGDRYRMKEAEGFADVFIRSMAQRDYPGGVCRAAIGAVCVMEAMGKDLVMIESIGAGQADSELFFLADTVVTVFTPEFGDELQLMKAGLLEIGHVVVVNKSDKPDAEGARAAIETYASSVSKDGWETVVLAARADREEGVEELIRSVKAHGAYCKAERKRTRGEKYRRFAMNLLREKVWSVFQDVCSETSLTDVMEAVESGRIDPYSAVERAAGEFARVVRTGLSDSQGRRSE